MNNCRYLIGMTIDFVFKWRDLKLVLNCYGDVCFYFWSLRKVWEDIVDCLYWLFKGGGIGRDRGMLFMLYVFLF